MTQSLGDYLNAEPVARARKSDPPTAHEAAERVTIGRQTQLIYEIWRLVKEFPSHNIRWYVNTSCERHGYDAGWYGTLGTNFKKAEQAGLIVVSGEEVSEYTGRTVRTYTAADEAKADTVIQSINLTLAEKEAAKAQKAADRAVKIEQQKAERLGRKKAKQDAKVRIAQLRTDLAEARFIGDSPGCQRITKEIWELGQQL